MNSVLNKGLKQFVAYCFDHLQNGTSLDEAVLIYSDLSTMLQSAVLSARVNAAIGRLYRRIG